MKRLIVLFILTTVCSTSMAGISTDIEDWYEDLLQFFDMYSDREEILEKVEAYDEMTDPSYTPAAQSYEASVNTDTEIYLNDLSLSDPTRISRFQIDPGLGEFDNPDSPVISNPEPCSVILSSIGLGIVGYLKRRRAI